MSTVVDMFDGGGSKPKIEPMPTRNTAADALDPDAERKRRALLGMTGAGQTMLSGPGGVPSELTGTRNIR